MEQLEPQKLLMEIYDGKTILENVWQFLKNITMHQPYESSISLLGIQMINKNVYRHKDLYLNV